MNARTFTVVPYRVGVMRAAGLSAIWGKTRGGRPIILVAYPKAKEAHQRDRWWVVDRAMHALMQELGIVEGFDTATMLGDLFSVSV